MFETAGPLANVRPALMLIGLVVLPLVWAALAAACARPRFGAVAGERRPASETESVFARMASITCAMATLGLAVVVAVRLAMLPPNHVLVQHIAQVARLGQLDLTLDLAVDTRSATFALVVAVVACGSALQTTLSTRPGKVTRLAWTGLLSAGAMLLCIADGFAPILIALGFISLGAWGLSRGEDAYSTAAGLAGNASVLLGLIFLFWSLGGAFGPAGYDPDGAPRFVLVATGATSDPPDKATLTMSTHAGALVSSDDADLPGEPITAPFSVSVQPGVYTLRVQGGAASGDVVVPRVALTAGHVSVLTPYGPTASLRSLDDQLRTPRMSSTGGPASVRAALTSRTIGGLRASAIVLLLVLGGALAHVHALANRRGPSAIVSVLEAMPAPYLALRFAPLVDPSAADGVLVAILGAGSAVILCARAAGVEDAQKVLRGVLAGSSSVALAVAGLGEPAAALIIATSTLVATSAALAAIDARRDVRWLGVACAAAVGVLPGAGASPGFILGVAAALGSAVTGGPSWAVFAAGVGVAIIVATTLGTLAVFRVYDAVIRASVRDPGTSRAQGAVVIGLTVLALLGGIVLGAGTTMFGGHVVPLARRLAGASTLVPTPRSMAGAAVVLTLAAAALGVALARRASSASSRPVWLAALGRPYAVLAWSAGGLGQLGAFLHASVRAMDRDVVEDVPAALRDVALRGVAALTRVADSVSKRAEPRIDRAAGAIAVKLDLDDPRASDRFRTVVLLAMVALLGLVVLSSVFLG